MAFRKKVFACAGATSLFYGPGRKEFDPSKPMPTFESYLKETAGKTLALLHASPIDEGIISSFMSQRFLHQGNLPGFLPFMVPSLKGKPCTAVEGACGSGGRAIAAAVRSVLSDLSDTVFVAGFEVQNGVKALYGADILAGAGYYSGERKKGHAFFFPGVFAERAAAYFKKYGEEKTRKALAKWYESAITNARLYPLAQEYHNKVQDLYALGLTSPQPERFLPCLNPYDCSKVTDGAASIMIASEEGLKKLGVDRKDAIEIIALGEAEGDITEKPRDLTELTQTKTAAREALQHSGLTLSDLALLEIHDCFTISGLLAIEAIGLASPGTAPEWVLQGSGLRHGILPVNLSGGLIGFGHPTGGSGVRMLVDLWLTLTKKAPEPPQLKSPYGMMISMGGNDVTVTAVIASA